MKFFHTRSIRLLAALIVVAALWVIIPERRIDSAPPIREVAVSELSLRDKRLYWRHEATPFTGVMVETYLDGSRKSRSTLSNGVLHGVSEGWHTNGMLQVREHFQGGVSQGKRFKWFANGNRMSEAFIEHGKIHGTFRRWHENGSLAEELSMRAGEPDGVSRSFFPNGALKAQVTFQNGKMLDQRFWKEGESPVTASALGSK